MFSRQDVLLWIEKWRPTRLDDITSQTQVVDILRKYVKNKNLPHLLLYGPSGTGKTSAISAVAHELYGENIQLMVLEINASVERGIEIVRTKINQFATSENIFYGEKRKEIFKLIILDEADAMTDNAQAILRKVIEKYTPNTRFCLICNYIKKISPALQSRCTCFRFSPLEEEHIKKRLIEIVKKENINITEDGIDTIIKRGKGDMRKIINMLQVVSMSYNKIDENIVNKCLSYPSKSHITKVFEYLILKSFSDTNTLIEDLCKEYRFSLLDIINEIHSLITNHITEKEICPILNNNKISQERIIFILKELCQVEYNLSVCTNESIQLCNFISIFKYT